MVSTYVHIVAIPAIKEITMSIASKMRKLGKNESGAALLEYSVLLGVILVAAVGAMLFAGDWVSTQWSTLQTKLETTTTTTTTTGGATP